MLDNASHLTVGDATQVNARAYNRSGSSKISVSDGGQYSSNTEIHARVYQEIRGDDSTLKELYTHIAPAAMHNSAARGDAPKCHPETRKAVQEHIFRWMSGTTTSTAPQDAEKILWLTGPAGTGKTAIMGTVSDRLEEAGRLAAAFYFSSFKGTGETVSKRRFVTTVAYQLAVHPALKDRLSAPILSAVRDNPVIFDMCLKRQLEMLILQPLRSSQGHPPSTSSSPLSIVIDGVDECGEPGDSEASRSRRDDQVEVLSILLQAINDPAFPFRFVVASRPQTWIRTFFTDSASGKFTEIFLDNKYNPDDDIRLFLKSKFTELCRRNRLNCSMWPSEKAIAKLVEAASGQFIYVATVLHFIDTPGTSPHAQLDTVLNIRPCASRTSDPFGVLDTLYTSILRSSPSPETTVLWLKAIQRVQGTRSVTPSAWTINRLLESHAGQAQTLLGGLPSLINTPEYRDGLRVDSKVYGEQLGVLQPTIPTVGWRSVYIFYHKSFLEYLGDNCRCGAAFPDIDGNTVDEWIQGRLCRTFKCGGPEVPVDSALLLVFRRCFLNLLISPLGLGKYSRVDDDILSACDPTIWLDLAGRVSCIDTSYERVLYSLVHNTCRLHRPCNPGCKLWRHAISKLSNDRWRQPDHWKPWSSFDILLDRFKVKRLEP